jgi:hypothetical protein
MTAGLLATTAGLPAMTAGLPATTAGLPATTAGLPAMTAGLPATTAGLPAMTAGLPATTAGLPAMTAGLPAMTASYNKFVVLQRCRTAQERAFWQEGGCSIIRAPERRDHRQEPVRDRPSEVNPHRGIIGTSTPCSLAKPIASG